MDASNFLPHNTFRPIREVSENVEGAQARRQLLKVDDVTSPELLNPLSLMAMPRTVTTSKLTKGGWRQGSDNWSSTGSRQSSRPGSAVGSSRPSSSTHLQCWSGNSSASDLSVARNFQQMSVSNRRAAFKTQKWSQSFDQGSSTTATPCMAAGATPSPNCYSGSRRRQSSLQQKSLDLDSGYLGSPASVFASCSQSWTGDPQGGEAVQLNAVQSGCNSGLRSSPIGGLQIEEAKRELVNLISRNEQESDKCARSASLPSFPESFHHVNAMPDHLMGLLSTSSQMGYRIQVTSPEALIGGFKDELDDLDEEIKQIVGDIMPLSDSKASSTRTLSAPQSGPHLPAGSHAHGAAHTKEYLRPRPIRSSTITFSPTGDLASIQQASVMTQSGGSLTMISSEPAKKEVKGACDASEVEMSSPGSANFVGQGHETEDNLVKSGQIMQSGDSGEGDNIMLAVVTTLYQTYNTPRAHPPGNRYSDGKPKGVGDALLTGGSTMSTNDDIASILKEHNITVVDHEDSPAAGFPSAACVSLTPSRSIVNPVIMVDHGSDGCLAQPLNSNSINSVATTATAKVGQPKEGVESAAPNEASRSPRLWDAVDVVPSGSDNLAKFVFKPTSQFSGKVDDFPKPKPFRPSHLHQPTSDPLIASRSQPSVQSESPQASSDNQGHLEKPSGSRYQPKVKLSSPSDKMLLETFDPSQQSLFPDAGLHSPTSPHYAYSGLHSPCSSQHSSLMPSPSYPASSSQYFQFPPVSANGNLVSISGADGGCAIKEEVPMYWSTTGLEVMPAQHQQQPSFLPPASISFSSGVYDPVAGGAGHMTSSTSMAGGGGSPNSCSPMLMSPAASNLNTPRVSLSSHHSVDLSARLRSSHSSLRCSPHSISPLDFLEPVGTAGGFGHSLSSVMPAASPTGYPSVSTAAETNMEFSHQQLVAEDLAAVQFHQERSDAVHPDLERGYHTPPRSGYSSPMHNEKQMESCMSMMSSNGDNLNAIMMTSQQLPSYEESMQHAFNMGHQQHQHHNSQPQHHQEVADHIHMLETSHSGQVKAAAAATTTPMPVSPPMGSPFLQPLYPFELGHCTGMGEPAIYVPAPYTPDPDSSLPSEKEEPPDTPDSSIKEEPSEEMSEEGTRTCRWQSCGREFPDIKSLVDHLSSQHIENKKGCEEYPCFWENCPRTDKPFNAKYKLTTHMRVHTGEKPHICKQEGCNRRFARTENLKIHYRTHTGEKPFHCKFQCAKKFSNSSDRAKHEQTHKDPKPYRCEVVGCQKRYTDPSSLRKHTKGHSREELDMSRANKELSLFLSHEDQMKQQPPMHYDMVVAPPSSRPVETALSDAVRWQQAPQVDPLSSLPTLSDHCMNPAAGQHAMATGSRSETVVAESNYYRHHVDNLRMQSQQTPAQLQQPHQQPFKKAGIERQADSLDSVEGEETTLPYDSIPIRYDPTDEWLSENVFPH